MKKKVKLVIVIVLIVLIVLFIICRTTGEGTNGNIANLGLACEYNGVVYYNKYEKGIFAYQDGNETQLTDETAYSINVVDDKIYYITIADFNNVVIKSVDTDGQNLKSISSIYTSISKIYVDEGKIYYSTNETGKGIASIDLNGENETILVLETVQDFQVENSIIYFVNSENKVCKMENSSDIEVLNDSITAKKIQVIGDWIYYYNQTENALFRLKNDGKTNELVSVLIHNETYNISGDYVYYFDQDNSKIARMQIGKSNQCDDIAFLSVSKTKINIAGDEVYYLDKSSDEGQTYQIYKVKINGDDAGTIEY